MSSVEYLIWGFGECLAALSRDLRALGFRA